MGAMGGRCGRCPRCALRRRGTEREAAPWLGTSEPWLGMAVNEASHGASLCIVVGPSGYTPIEPLLQRRKRSSAIGATGAEFMNFFLIPLPTRNAHPMPLMYLAHCCSEPTNARTNHNKEEERRKKRYTTPRPRGQVHGLRSDPLVQSMQAPVQARSHAVMPCQWPRGGTTRSGSAASRRQLQIAPWPIICCLCAPHALLRWVGCTGCCARYEEGGRNLTRTWHKSTVASKKRETGGSGLCAVHSCRSGGASPHRALARRGPPTRPAHSIPHTSIQAFM